MTANLAELVARSAAERPDGVALISAEDGATTTWAQLEDAVSRCAGGYAAQGLVAGNRVAIAVANRVEFVVLYLGALRARLVAVPVNPRSATGELVRMVADSGARLLVADATTVDSARSVVTGLREALATEGVDVSRPATPRLVVLDSSVSGDEISYDVLLASEATALPPARDAETLAVLLYTSGTSGRPRAAMLSHRALLANIAQAASVAPPLVRPEDVVYGVLPLFHVYGLNAVLGQVLDRGATLVVVDGFDLTSSLRQIEELGVTVLPVAPPILHAWRSVEDLADRLRGVRSLMSGSAPLGLEILQEYLTRFGLTVHQGYGLTEAAPLVTSTLCSRSGRSGEPSTGAERGSVGAPLPGVELRLVDETGSAPEAGDPGEILVRGDNLFSGYWPDGVDGPVDGWLSTGDLGFVDADGDLWLVERLKEIVIVSGFNVYPSEIEELLTEVPEVLAAAVVGVPDEATGEAVVAFLQLAAGADPEHAAEQVQHRCAERLARFKQPKRIEVVDALPRTVTGKLARGRLRERVRRGAPGILE